MQFYYFSEKRKDKSFNTFVSKRIKPSYSEVSFQIDSLIHLLKNCQVKVFKVISELKDSVKNNGKQQRKVEKKNNNGIRSARTRFLL